ncbi:redoxin domain-containing protein [Porphyromonas sp.]|uniref:redoxin domain-containing protein n=1 Tax=Porphyromonas sp. TaxID=1924944 RepID=UPI0026DB49B1|nr:redoxin domain-containing protein [Porphyromonas sp.]MDO4771298.1 thioredoxin-like domain-containing protein [Porphyromonas sp.]
MKTYFTLKTSRLFGVMALMSVIFISAGCAGNAKKPGYTISGTIEGAANGDSVYLEIIKNAESKVLGTAVIQDGAFTLEGTQDSIIVCYLTCSTSSDVFSFPFFLENGNIMVKVESGQPSVTGTATNDIYQEIRNKTAEQIRRMNEIDQDESLTEEQKEEKMDEAEMAYDQALKDGMANNITNPVGIFLFKERYYENSLSENQELIRQIPSEYMNDPYLIGIKRQLEHQEKTDVSKLFTDFSMQTPEGKTVKLSDYVGKGKPVLVDFWASWCAPCRQSMPALIEIYTQYKGKFEIVGVSFDEEVESWKRAISKLELPWPQMSDLKGWKSEAAKEYGIHSIPHTLLIDNDGVIIARDLKGADLAKKLAEILK